MQENTTTLECIGTIELSKYATQNIKQLTCSKNYICLPTFNSDDQPNFGFDVYQTQGSSKNQSSFDNAILSLQTGHRTPISCFLFSEDSDDLCTCSSDSVFVWPIQHLVSQKIKNGIKILQLSSSENSSDADFLVNHCSATKNFSFFAFCISNFVLVYQSSARKLIMKLEGHNSLVTSSKFLELETSDNSNKTVHKLLLITAGMDKCFKIWDTESKTSLYRSEVFGNCPFQHIAIDWKNNFRFILSNWRGNLFIYDISEKNEAFCFPNLKEKTRTINTLIGFELQKQKKQKNGTIDNIPKFEIVSDEPVWKQQHNFLSNIFSEANSDPNGQIFPFLEPGEASELQNSTIVFLEYLRVENTKVICCATKDHFILMNSNNFDITHFFKFDFEEDFAQNLTITYLDSLKTLQLFVLTEKYHLNVLFLDLKAISSEKFIISSKSLSFFQSSDSKLPPKFYSPIFEDKATKKPTKTNKTLIEKPIFMRPGPIPSSNYGKTPPFSLKTTKKPTNPVSKPTVLQKKSLSSSDLTSKNTTIQEPVQFSAPKTLQSSISVHENNGFPISWFEKSNCSNFFAFSTTADNSIRVFPFQGSLNSKNYNVSEQIRSYSFHTAKVNAFKFADFDQNLFLASSNDGSSSLWKIGVDHPLFVVKRISKNYSSLTSNLNIPKKTSNSSEEIFNGPIVDCSFLGQDKAFVLANNNSLFFYKYEIREDSLDTSKKPQKKKILLGNSGILNLNGLNDSNEKINPQNFYKLVSKFESSNKQLNCLAVHNQIASNLVIFSGSAKKLSIFDINKNALVQEIEDAHSKQINFISLNENNYTSSSENSRSASSFEFFLTFGKDEVVKLWDIRVSKGSNSCCMKFSGHKNSVHKIGGNLSIDGNYVCCGSEDNSVFVYDVRSGGKVLEKFSCCANDVVTKARFGKKSNSLWTCSLDGRFRQFV